SVYSPSVTAPKATPFLVITSYQSIPSLAPLIHLPPSEIGASLSGKRVLYDFTNLPLTLCPFLGVSAAAVVVEAGASAWAIRSAAKDGRIPTSPATNHAVAPSPAIIANPGQQAVHRIKDISGFLPERSVVVSVHLEVRESKIAMRVADAIIEPNTRA